MRRRRESKKKQVNSPKTNFKNQRALSIENIKVQLNHTDDLKDREIHINHQIYIILYIAPIVDQEKLETKVIEPLTKTENNDISNVLYNQEINRIRGNEKAINGLLDGNCLLMKKDGHEEGLLLNVNASHGRDVSQLETEKTILGPHEGFVEDLDKNISLLRKRTENPRFTVKKYPLGAETNTDVALIYLNNLVNPEILKKVDQRLKSINLDSIRSSGNIQDCIEDDAFSPFPQLLVTERPDRTAANLMDGRAVLLIDGDPTVFVLPATFMMFFQSPDDYVNRWGLGSFFRILRLLSYVNALLFPAFYVALVSFHYEIFPTELVYSFQSSLSYVPFRPIIELMIMQFSLELLREASIRLPNSIAQTFGIVGGLVVGTAMVEAGLVSYGGLIVVAITAVSSFAQPNIEMSSTIRVLGFPLMIMAATFGLLGIMLGSLFIFIHLSRITSFGVPYFAPFAPLNIHEFKDTIIRLPVWMQDKRPKTSSRYQKGKTSREWKSHESEEPY
ncbi:spore germination protein [Virgibacillus sp. NKC19-16]|uniref:spore germination protein n=1 Tax=Virgibacillus salidurans TaxID=2831673 RepID=UPI001F330F95|nr:spore germination protein [Virgibacillus sp. NKC19-16]UJL46909.1 spore germination protein [Virgibacillus sp. NKC19-16]